MKKLQYKILTIALAAGVAVTAPVARAEGDADGMGLTFDNPVETPSLLKLSKINVAHSDGALRVSFDINPERVKLGRDRQVVFTPVIRSMGLAEPDSVVLDPLTIAGRNRYYSHLRNGDIKIGSDIYRAGEKGKIEYSRSVNWEDWMDDCSIYMREETQDCCRPVKPLCDTPVAQINTIDSQVKKTNSQAYIALTGDSAVEREAQGRAFIDFIVNRTEIRDDYRKNPRELKKIIESINAVKDDPDATITRLTIKGYASPEGSYDNNVRLAMGRTEALKEYVRKMYNFDPEIMITSYEPEDWGGLREWLETCNLPHRDEIIAIVESDMAPDPKDQAIKSRYPHDYKIMLDSIYPALRHSDYTVRYKIRTYVDIEELKRVYRDNPENLRPVDFYRVAQTYPTGSREYDEVMLKASEIYPHDAQAAINAANILMRRGELKKADDKLSRAGESGEAYYSRGMLAIMNEDYERAERLFGKAKELGMRAADAQLDMLKRNKNRERVTYLINAEE